MSTYFPENYPSVSPYLVCSDAQALVDFLVKVFGGSVPRKEHREDGSIMHIEVKIGNGVVMIGSANEKFEPVTAWVHVYVPDVDAVQQRALENGATEMFPVTRKDGDTDRRGGFIDLWGNAWFPSTQEVAA